MSCGIKYKNYIGVFLMSTKAESQDSELIYELDENPPIAEIFSLPYSMYWRVFSVSLHQPQ
jgi:hypothetical protein